MVGLKKYCEQCEFCYAEETEHGEIYYCGCTQGRGFNSPYEEPCEWFEDVGVDEDD